MWSIHALSAIFTPFNRASKEYLAFQNYLNHAMLKPFPGLGKNFKFKF